MKNPVSSLQPVPKSQRTEVRLHELTKQERDQFEQAKATEVANWIQTKTPDQGHAKSDSLNLRS